jgi:HD superfamily phosphohydrolase YqeK
MEKTAYARSINSRGTQQTVQEHLLETAQLAADNASAFDAREEGRLAGPFHDLGKYGELFQKVLRRKADHIDHAMPGAIVASQAFPCHRHHIGALLRDDVPRPAHPVARAPSSHRQRGGV